MDRIESLILKVFLSIPLRELNARCIGAVLLLGIFQLPLHALDHSLLSIQNIPPTSVSKYAWHTFYGSSGSDDFGYAVAQSSDGSVYIAGTSLSSWQGDNGVDPLHSHSGSSDLIVVKLDSNGVYQWHTFYGSNSGDDGNALAVAEDGSVYITGISNAPWQGDGGADPIHPHSGEGNSDLFVVKLSSDGTYQWHTFYGVSDGFDFGNDLAVAADGSVYIVGQAQFPWQGDGDADPIHEAVHEDIVIVKLSSDGAYQWHTFYGSSDPDGGIGIAVAMDGSVFITGASVFTWLGDNGEDPIHPHDGSGEFDLVVIKLDSDGAYQWHTFYGSSGADWGSSLAVDSDGNLYIAGYSDEIWRGDGGAEPIHPHGGSGKFDLVVIKLDSDGAYQWHTFYGSSSEDIGTDISAERGSVYVAGYSDATWRGDGGAEPIHPYSGMRDLVVMKLDSDGAYQWHTFYGSSGSDDFGYAVAQSSDGSVYVAGYSDATWRGDGGAEPIHPYSGMKDLVVVKFSEVVNMPTCEGEPATIVGAGKITGTPERDVIVGSDGPDQIDGGAGNDVICGLGGDDLIKGGPDEDFIRGGEGNDLILDGDDNGGNIFGEGGNDIIYGGKGNENIRSGPGNDILIGGGGNDSLIGEAGDDRLFSGSGHGDLRGGLGDDLLVGGPDRDDIIGEEGNDQLFGLRGDDRLNGGPNTDLCVGGPGSDDLEECEIEKNFAPPAAPGYPDEVTLAK